MKKVLIITLLAILGSYGIASAQQQKAIVADNNGWQKIGERTVDFKKDRDEIRISKAERFAAIKFNVTDAAIDLMDLEVYYDSGAEQAIKVNMPIKGPGESRILELNGGTRNLKKIVFIYKTIPNRKDDKAHIELWGLKTNTDKM